MSLKAETEMALKLLEKDIHEKQDTIVSLRRQLEDIKQINLEMYNKLQVYITIRRLMPWYWDENFTLFIIFPPTFRYSQDSPGPSCQSFIFSPYFIPIIRSISFRFIYYVFEHFCSQ